MNVSRYTLFVEDCPQPGEYLLFNTLTQACVGIDGRLKKVLDDLPAEQCDEAARAHLVALKEMGILVDEDTDESLVVEQWFDQLRHDTSAVGVMVLTTYACNFKCTYCVEEGVKRNVRMDETMCRKVTRWVERLLDRTKPECLRVNFYGGEPLLNTPAIRFLSQAFHKLCQDRNIEYRFIITTNGSLLTKDLAEELTPYGLTGVKVTVDGDRETHNRTRPFKGGRGSFGIILNNLIAVADSTQVMIGGNFDETSVGSIPALLDELERQGLRDRLYSVDFAPVVARMTDSGYLDGGYTCFSRGDLPEKMVEVKRETLRRGFKTRAGLGIGVCGMVLENSGFVIDPLGAIYKCPALVGRPGFQVGHVESDELNALHNELVDMTPWRSCGECPYVPMCVGGCRYLSYLEYGTLDRVVCEREYLDRAGPELLRMEYEDATPEYADSACG